jgi:hypothetical protein
MPRGNIQNVHVEYNQYHVIMYGTPGLDDEVLSMRSVL